MGKIVPEQAVEYDNSQPNDDVCETPIVVDQEKVHKRKNNTRRHKNLDRLTLADVTANCTLSSTGNGTKGKGKRRLHRLENVKYLLSLWNKEDEDDGNYYDEPLQTIFTKIVTDEDNRKIWNDFTSLSGEEQDQYLAFIGQSENRRKQWTKLVNTRNNDVTEPSGNPAYRVDIVDTTLQVENLSVHNSLVADACYKRIERRLRNALNNKHVPLGMLENLETELTAFFIKWPTSKYTSVLSSSYERLLMHALCQYLGLLSQSITGNDGNRCTQVQTKPQSSFHPPSISLCQYIKERL